jgi:hypothetical protein
MKGALFRSCLFVPFVANFFSKSKTAAYVSFRSAGIESKCRRPCAGSVCLALCCVLCYTKLSYT